MNPSHGEPRLALDLLYEWEARSPGRVVFTQPMADGSLRDLSWRDLMHETRRIAAHLRDRNFPGGSRIAILSKNCVHWLMSDFAIWMAGHVSVPLYPTLSAGTIRQILEHSEARLLFVGKLDGWEAMSAGVPPGLACITYPLSPPTPYDTWDEIVRDTAPLQGCPMRDAAELATIIYTSGTTGMPKGVMHSFGALAWALHTGMRRLSLSPEDRVLSYLPLAHIVERTLVEQGLLATGMHVYFVRSLDTFAQDLRRARPTAFFSVPRLWAKFQQGVHAKIQPRKLQRMLGTPLLGRFVRRKILRTLGLDRCRVAAGGAAPMPTELLQWYARLGLEVLEGYGMTENCGVSHANVLGRARPGTVGLPYEGVLARVDPATGEVQMRSGALMLGYYKEPGLTREAFTEDGWLHTGDRGEIDADGNLRITGRIKDLFKTSKGKYVAPAPIEDRLAAHPAIEACVVLGAFLPQPIAIALLGAESLARAAPGTPARADLEASLEQHVARVNDVADPHERLAQLILTSEPWTVDNGLVTPTLKVRRARVEEVYASELARANGAARIVTWAQSRACEAAPPVTARA
ncbi:MAG TPA: AMP-binding protein [Burkholderiaceae bacterium]|nr:AMP-binding protein [Burkholderiaceae bacterium]